MSRQQWAQANEPTAPQVFRSEAFRGRVYGITGAGQHIGESLAHSLTRWGAHVVLVDRHESRLHRVERDLRVVGGEVRTVCGDVAERAVIERAVDLGVETWGRVDGWVSNVPANPHVPLAEQTEEHSEYIWQVNVEAARRAVQRLIPVMSRQGSARSSMSVPSSRTECAPATRHMPAPKARSKR